MRILQPAHRRRPGFGRRRSTNLLLILGLFTVLLGPSVVPDVAAASDPVLIAAGDIAGCGTAGDTATAALVRAIPGIVATLGDTVYPNGSAAQFASCYAPTWGVARSRTRPAPGNHDYGTAGAAGYFGYFGSRAGNPRYGFYAYNLGTWRIYVLNSNCWAVGGCGAGSPQERWLRTDLGRYPHQCVLAYWHHPLFSSGPHGDNAFVRPLWNDLYGAHADVILNGHDHDYERFAPQSPSGVATSRGIREFVVGTGGFSHYRFGAIQANSQVRNGSTFGVLKLTLHASSYSWQFVPVAGSTFRDAGSTACR